MGPGTVILLRDPLTTQQRQEVDEWLHAIGTITPVEPKPWWSIRITSLECTAITLEDTSTACGFMVNVVDIDDTLEFPHLQEGGSYITGEVREQLGFSPKQFISVSANCKKLIDMQILGCLVLDLATRFGAVIDLLSVIRPASHFKARHIRLLNREPWRRFEEIDEYIRQMPGSIMPLYSSEGMGQFSFTHIVDVEFLTNWLRNPQFYM